MMKRMEMLSATESILKTAGFNVSERCCARPSCFDFAVRREEQVAFIKISTNIENIAAKDASELKMVSGFFSAAPLFISEKMRYKPIEDDTVYERYGINAITVKTLEDIISRKMQPLVEAGPGGYYVNLDNDVIKEKRQKLGLSIGKLAEMLGISRRTLYGYEKGLSKASVSAAYNLEWTLGIPLAKSIDIFETSPQDRGFFATARLMIIRNRFLQRVMRKFAQIDFRVAPIRKAPFDFMAQSSEESLNILGGVVSRKERNIDKRTEEIMSISKIVNAQPILIADGPRTREADIPLISHEDLEKIKHAGDFIAKL
jgi:putative transcriptional regulator